MKKYFKNLKMILVAVPAIFAGTSLLAVEMSSELTKMNLKVCNQKNSRCMDMQAEKGIGSSLAPLHSLKNVVVSVTEKKSGKITKYKSENGYLDLSYNRIVLTENFKDGVKETVFDLEQLEPKLMVMK